MAQLDSSNSMPHRVTLFFRVILSSKPMPAEVSLSMLHSVCATRMLNQENLPIKIDVAMICARIAEHVIVVLGRNQPLAD
jgi:hypothetical protein